MKNFNIFYFNPQPEPPRGGGISHVSLNPQPLPPGPPDPNRILIGLLLPAV